MNPYDAILEHLRKAQHRGVETVSNRLDFVLESLEAMVNEAREAVKEAIPGEPEELFPVAECSRAVEEARDNLEATEARAKELEAAIETLKARLAEAESRPAGALNLEVLRRLDAARTQSELLKELLPSLLDHVGRAAVLVVREGTVSAWSGIGFQEGERLRGWSAKLVESPVLEKFVHENGAVRFAPMEDGLFRSWLEGEAAPSEAVIIPVVLRGRTVGGIYADRLEGAPWDVKAAQVMVATACWLIDTLSFRTIVPSPALQEPVGLGAEEEAQGEAMDTATPEAGHPPVQEIEETRREAAETAEAPEAEPVAEEAPVESPPEPAGEAPAEEPVEVSAGQPVEAPGEEESPPEPQAEPVPQAEIMPGEPATTIQIERPESWAEPGAAEEEAPAPPEAEPEAPPEAEAEEPAAPAAPAPVEAPVSEPAEPMEHTSPPPVAPVVPPPVAPVVPPPPEETPAAVQGAGERPPEEEARHEEARRFARLLVSEIKLYNPEEVERGRAENNIYQRLKEDIDRSREMYEKRVSEEVRASHDYFREALIRILADGNEDALGM